MAVTFAALAAVTGLEAQSVNRISPSLIGRGYDPLQSQVLAPCVTFSGDTDLADVATDPQTAGRVGLVTFELDEVTSREQLRRALQVSAAASVGIGPFSGTATAKMLQSTEFSRYNRYFTVRASIEMIPRQLATPSFTVTATSALEQGADAFFFSCGSEYVSGAIKGATMTAVVEIRTESEADAKAVDASVRGGYGGVFSAKGDVSQRLNKLKNFAHTKVSVIRNGVLEPIPGVDGLIGTVQGFPVSAADGNTVPIFGMTSSYRSVTNLPTGAISKLKDLDGAVRDFTILAEAQLGIEQRIADLQYVKVHPAQFEMAQFDLSQATETADAALTAIQDAVFACSRQPSICAELRHKIPPLPPLPELKPRVFATITAVVDPKGPLQCIGDVPAGESVSLTVQGRWRYSNGPTPFVDVGGHTRIIEGQYVHNQRAGTLVVQIRDLSDNERSIGIFTGNTMYIPPGSRVCVAMNDDVNYYGDNENDPQAPMKVTLAPVK